MSILFDYSYPDHLGDLEKFNALRSSEYIKDIKDQKSKTEVRDFFFGIHNIWELHSKNPKHTVIPYRVSKDRPNDKVLIVRAISPFSEIESIGKEIRLSRRHFAAIPDKQSFERIKPDDVLVLHAGLVVEVTTEEEMERYKKLARKSYLCSPKFYSR
ncbi:hypothetical protein D6829_00245 [Candidatus Pacearchaeota archaeon]|nr:MAG: hypothetical protein D6829_00245 [Candidatus Pacearchaeota archaeon]